MLSQLSYVPMTDRGYYTALPGKMQAVFLPHLAQYVRRNLGGGEVVLTRECIGVVAVEELLRQTVVPYAYALLVSIERRDLLSEAAWEDAVLDGEDEAVGLGEGGEELRIQSREIERVDNGWVQSLVRQFVRRLRGECGEVADTDECDICTDARRDRSTVCVVENVQNVMALEATGQYHGLYHVLGGVISPMDGIGPSDLNIASLVERVVRGEVKEVIFALNPTMEGDTTNFYISRQLAALPSSEKPVALSVLARGVSVGDDLEYADEVTLGRSLVDRVEFRQ